MSEPQIVHLARAPSTLTENLERILTTVHNYLPMVEYMWKEGFSLTKIHRDTYPRRSISSARLAEAQNMVNWLWAACPQLTRYVFVRRASGQDQFKYPLLPADATCVLVENHYSTQTLLFEKNEAGAFKRRITLPNPIRSYIEVNFELDDEDLEVNFDPKEEY